MVLALFHLLALSASLIATILLTTYILYKKIKSAAAFYYFVFMLTVISRVGGDLFFQLAQTEQNARFWLNFYWLGMIFMAAIFFLFATSFPRPRNDLFENEKEKIVVLLFPLFVSYLLFFSNDFVSKITISNSDINYVIYGNLYWLVVGYLALFLGSGFFVLYEEYKKTQVASEKRNIELVFIGCFIAAFFGLLGDVFLVRLLGFGELKLASVFIFFSCIVMGYVAVQHKVFTIKPVSEENVDTKVMFSAELGKIYSFEEKNETRRRGFRFFADLVKHGRQGLLVSTIYPEQVRKIYNLMKTPVIWVTDSQEMKEEKINPKEIDALNRSICLFLERANNPVLLIEGIKQLVIENGSSKVVEFLNSITSKTKETKTTLFFSLRGEESRFIELFNEVNSLKGSLVALNEKYFSRTISENAYLELLRDLEKEIIDREAEFRIIEDFLLGKISVVSSVEKKKLLLEKSIQLINYKAGKRTLDARISEPLRNSLQKELVALEQSMNKRNLVEKI